jgi:hypothetical protein
MHCLIFLRVYSEEVMVLGINVPPAVTDHVSLIEDPLSVAVSKPTHHFPSKPNTTGNLPLDHKESGLIYVTYAIDRSGVSSYSASRC